MPGIVVGYDGGNPKNVDFIQFRHSRVQEIRLVNGQEKSTYRSSAKFGGKDMKLEQDPANDTIPQIDDGGHNIPTYESEPATPKTGPVYRGNGFVYMADAPTTPGLFASSLDEARDKKDTTLKYVIASTKFNIYVTICHEAKLRITWESKSKFALTNGWASINIDLTKFDLRPAAEQVQTSVLYAGTDLGPDWKMEKAYHNTRFPQWGLK
jgi:hypothetical protein